MAEAQACVPNIGPRQRRHRLIVGIAASSVTIVAATLLLAGESPRAWRLLLLVPAFVAWLGIFQARAQTCVALAARGVRNMDAGDERVVDDQADLQIRQQARGVLIKAIVAAAGVTALLLLN